MISSLNESQQEIINLKKKFLLDRKKIESSFLKNNLGQRNCNENTKLIDNLIKQIFKIIHKMINMPNDIPYYLI